MQQEDERQKALQVRIFILGTSSFGDCSRESELCMPVIARGHGRSQRKPQHAAVDQLHTGSEAHRGCGSRIWSISRTHVHPLWQSGKREGGNPGQEERYDPIVPVQLRKMPAKPKRIRILAHEADFVQPALQSRVWPRAAFP